jgi:hypothetical protein
MAIVWFRSTLTGRHRVLARPVTSRAGAGPPMDLALEEFVT